MLAYERGASEPPVCVPLKRTLLTVFLSGVTFAVALLATLMAMLLSPTDAGAQEVEIHSVVMEEGTEDPISTVQISVAGRTVLTDSEGRFTLRLDDPDSEVEFQRLGYESLIVPASSIGNPVHLRVRPVLLESFVVSAPRARHHVLAEGTALSAQSVSRDEVGRNGTTSLSEAIDEAEGVSVSYMGSWGSRPVLRGLSGERLAVMVDGMRVNRACTYGMDQGLSTIDPALVERVEILSGPGSTLYGSGNVGGAINVVTRSPAGSDQKLSGEVRASTSSAVPGTSLGATLGRGGETWDAAFSIDGSYYDDYRSPAGVVDGSSYRQLTSDAKVGFDLDPTQRLSFGGQLYEGRDIGWPMRGDASIPRESRKSFSVDYGWQRGGFVDAFSAKAYIQRLDHFMEMRMSMPMSMGSMSGTSGGMDDSGMSGMSDTGGMSEPMTMVSTTEAVSHSTTSGGRAQLRLTPGDAVHVDVGTEATHLSAEGTRWTIREGMPGMDPSTTTFHTWPGVGILDLGLFGQGEVRVLDRVSFSGGVRLDHVVRDADDRPSTTEWITTGNVGAKVDLGAGFQLRSTLGYGYRVPDALELFGLGLKPDGHVYRGNPDLKTETSRNVEGTLSWTGSDVSASVTGFRNDLDGMILPVLVEGETISGKPVREYDNVAEARLTGVSASVSWDVDPTLRLGAGADYTRGENPRTDQPLPLMPPLEGSLSARYMPSGVDGSWIEVEGKAVDRQDRPAATAGEVETPGYGLLNVRSGFGMAGTDLIVGVENVFDRAYRSHLDPTTLLRPGRNFYVKLSRSF
ncbi:MAG: TonB-dependent receptor [Longimicrobiales bacterium]|nr:TonB-dependent receptor [Longimicrobiales bacterium]